MAFVDVATTALITAGVNAAGSAIMGGSSGGSPVSAADPFSSQRPQYQQQLAALMSGGLNTPALQSSASALGGKDPAGLSKAISDMLLPGGGQFTSSDPSYQFRLDQGSENVKRQMAASGMLNSGNTLAALSDYGQKTASQEYSNQFARLMGAQSQQFSQLSNLDTSNFGRLAELSGANSGSPAASGQLLSQQQGQASAMGQQIFGPIGQAAAQNLTGPSGWWF